MPLQKTSILIKISFTKLSTEMGSPKEVVAIYPVEKTSSDKIKDILKVIGKITLNFVMVVAAVWILFIIALWIYFRNLQFIQFNAFSLLIILLVYIVLYD